MIKILNSDTQVYCESQITGEVNVKTKYNFKIKKIDKIFYT